MMSSGFRVNLLVPQDSSSTDLILWQALLLITKWLPTALAMPPTLRLPGRNRLFSQF